MESERGSVNDRMKFYANTNATNSLPNNYVQSEVREIGDQMFHLTIENEQSTTSAKDTGQNETSGAKNAQIADEQLMSTNVPEELPIGEKTKNETHDDKKIFRKRRGTTDPSIKGRDYENYIPAYFILKFVKNDEIEDFEISSNDENFGAFDDVVLDIRKHDNSVEKYAVQLKHTCEKQTLTSDKLIKEKGDFSIKKYFKSFREFKRNLSDYKLILWTNQSLRIPDKSKFKLEEGFEVEVIEEPPLPLLHISEKAKCYKFRIVSEFTEKLDEYVTFFESFLLYTNQPNLNELRVEMIPNTAQSKTLPDKCIKFVEDWSYPEGVKTKLDKKTMQRVTVLLLLEGLIHSFSFNSPMNDNIKLLRSAISKFDIVRFHQNSLGKVKTIWSDMRAELGSIEEINKLRKQYQISPKYVSKINDLSDEECTKLLWVMGRCPLIVEDNCTTREAIKLCRDLKFVLIGPDSDDKLEKFSKLSDLTVFTDIFNSVTEQFTCSVPGELTLKELIQKDNECGNITTNDLLEWMNGPYVINQERENLPEIFITRRLSKNTIDFKFLHTLNTEETVIVISNLENASNELFKNFNLIPVDKYLNQVQENENKSKHFLGECKMKKSLKKQNLFVSRYVCSQEDFHKICKKNRDCKEFHHFRYENGELEWVKSVGNISNVDRYRHDNGHHVTEETIYSTNNVNVITADPGMGKSVFLKSLKNNLISKYWTVIVTPTDIHDFWLTENVKNVTSFEDFLLKTKYQKYANLDRKMLKLLMRKGEMALLWDALDELSDDEMKITEELILSFSQKVKLQWVTSRSHLKNILQNKFGVLSSTLLPFGKEEQVLYIKKRLDLREREEHVTELIMNNVDILGIPLQIFMITELFRQDLELYEKLFDVFFSLTDLYYHFVDEKFNVYFTEKCKYYVGTTEQQLVLTCFKEKGIEYYQKAALRTLFDDEILNQIGCDCNSFIQEIHKIGFVTGILEDSMRPQFIHSSYAEYFAASYLVDNCTKIPSMETIIFDRKYSNVRFFFDLLATKDCPAHRAVLYKDFENLKRNETSINCDDMLGRSPLHLLCSWGERYPVLEVKEISDETWGRYYQICDNNNHVIKEENQVYRNMLEYLLEKCEPSETDDVFKLNCLMYAEKCECLFTYAYIESKRKKGYLKTKPYGFILNMVYYGIKFGYDIIIDIICRDINFVTDLYGNSFLHIAAEQNRGKYIEKLVLQEEYKSRINSKNIYGKTPLHVASQYGRDSIVDLLIKSGGDVNAIDSTGWTSLHLASFNGHKSVVDLLIESDGAVNAIDSGGWTPLHHASDKGHDAIVDSLIKSGVDVNATDNNGLTSLHWASHNGHNPVVDLLIKSKGDVNAIDRRGWTPLHHASYKGQDSIADLLIKSGGDVNATDNNRWTSLHLASFNGQNSTVDLLTESNGDVNAIDSGGWTPLHHASDKGHDSIVVSLIKSGRDVNATDNNGWTSLHWASSNGHDSTADLLIKYGLDVNATDNGGRTPLHFASQNGHDSTVDYLIRSGEDVNVTDKGGWTPIDYATENGHDSTIHLLIALGGDVNVSDYNGRRSLHWASWYGHASTVDLLIRSGGDVNARENNGRTPLHFASNNGHYSTVDVLIKSGGDVNAIDKDGRIPLHFALMNNHRSTAGLLIKRGRNVSLPDNTSTVNLQI